MVVLVLLMLLMLSIWWGGNPNPLALWVWIGVRGLQMGWTQSLRIRVWSENDSACFFFFPEHVTVDPLAWHLQLRMYNHVYPSDFLDILISWWDTEPTDFRVFMLFWSTHSTVPIASIFRPPLNFPNYDAWQKDSTISNGDQDRSIGWCHPRVASENSKQQLHEGESNGDIYPVVAWVLVFNPRRCSHQCTARPSSAVSPVGILEFGKTGLGLVELESTRMFLD